jgi:hypothetical protein
VLGKLSLGYCKSFLDASRHSLRSLSIGIEFAISGAAVLPNL